MTSSENNNSNPIFLNAKKLEKDMHKKRETLKALNEECDKLVKLAENKRISVLNLKREIKDLEKSAASDNVARPNFKLKQKGPSSNQLQLYKESAAKLTEEREQLLQSIKEKQEVISKLATEIESQKR